MENTTTQTARTIEIEQITVSVGDYTCGNYNL